MSSISTIDAQTAREASQIEEGFKRAIARDTRAAALGEQTRTERLTLAHLVVPAAAFLREQVAAYTNGSRPPWWSVLRDLDLDEVAATAIRTGFSCALRRRNRTSAALEFGKALEVLYVFHGLLAKAEKAAARAKVKALVSARNSARARSKAILKAAIDNLGHEPWETQPWDQDGINLLVAMGAPLLNAALASGLFFVTSENKGNNSTASQFVLSDEGAALIHEVSDLGLLARPILRPMLAPPRPWTGLRRGGYLTDAMRPYTHLVSSRLKTQRQLLSEAVKDGTLTPTLESTSRIGAVPLRINAAVRDLRTWAWENQIDLGDVFPLRDPVATPEVPEDIKDWPQQDQRRFWASRARSRRVNDGVGPNLAGFNNTTAEAASLGDQTFYLPHHLDFRGRAYPSPTFGHHSGDATKALIEFARGKPLGEYGLDWLLIHCANCYDATTPDSPVKVSKRPYEDRIAWAYANLDDLIQETADRPRTDLRWTKADAPFSFYAACVEVAKAFRSDHPATYVSHLPGALDGSNSGVQHYAAMMRAEEGAYVNLTPAAAPADLYAKVAEAVSRSATRSYKALARFYGHEPARDELVGCMDKLTAEIDTVEAPAKAEERRHTAQERATLSRLKRHRGTVCAALWSLEGVTRKIVKRGVMTYGYSSAAFGMGQQVHEDYMEPLALQVMTGKLPSHPFGADEGRAAAGWMGRSIYRAVVAVLPRVAAAMQFLREIAGVLAAAGQGVLLVTPMGFPMLMRETEPVIKTVLLHLLDRTVPVLEKGSDDKVLGDSVLRRVRCMVKQDASAAPVLTHKQQSGVAPQVVHAMDACHLHMTVLELVSLGVEDMLVIHDSFATHFGDMGTLSAALRQTLVDLYEAYSPLEDIRDRALAALPEDRHSLVPSLPDLGALDLAGILEADYAFS